MQGKPMILGGTQFYVNYGLLPIKSLGLSNFEALKRNTRAISSNQREVGGCVRGTTDQSEKSRVTTALTF
jgi:hypothetical protein